MLSKLYAGVNLKCLIREKFPWIKIYFLLKGWDYAFSVFHFTLLCSFFNPCIRSAKIQSSKYNPKGVTVSRLQSALLAGFGFAQLERWPMEFGSGSAMSRRHCCVQWASKSP